MAPADFEPEAAHDGADTPRGPQPASDPTPIAFPACARPTLGVELEVSLIDPTTGALSPRAAEVLGLLEEQGPHAKPELFASIVELNTAICADVPAVRADLRGRLRALRDACTALGLQALCTGTHPSAAWRDVPISPDPRYAALIAQMGWPARRLLICGTHVHVGVKSGEHAVALMNTLTVFLPHFLALSASSPYWHGLDTHMASCRAKVFEGLPTAGLPPKVRNWGEFVSLMHTFLAAGSIRSIREIWWDIRPHPTFGTVELRICDGLNSLDEVCSIAAFAQALVAYMQELYDQGQPLPTLQAWTLAENKWRAARYGLDAQIIRNERGEQTPLRPHIEEWVARLRPTAQKLGCAHDLDRLAPILAHGPSHVRQRRWFAEGGLANVVARLCGEWSAALR